MVHFNYRVKLEGLPAEIDLVEVRNDEDAARLRFLGSPSIVLDGQDLFAVARDPALADQLQPIPEDPAQPHCQHIRSVTQRQEELLAQRQVDERAAERRPAITPITRSHAYTMGLLDMVCLLDWE